MTTTQTKLNNWMNHNIPAGLDNDDLDWIEKTVTDQTINLLQFIPKTLKNDTELYVYKGLLEKMRVSQSEQEFCALLFSAVILLSMTCPDNDAGGKFMAAVFGAPTDVGVVKFLTVSEIINNSSYL